MNTETPTNEKATVKTKDREYHRWEEFEGGMEKCKFCGAFRRREVRVNYMLMNRLKGRWIFYSKKGSSKWTHENVDCV